MPIRVRPVPYGPDATRALVQEVRAAKAQDALAPVTVVVPSNYLGVATRRALASGRYGTVVGDRPGVVGVSFLTVYRLAELLAAGPLAARGRRPVTTPVVGAAIRSVLARDPGCFAEVARHPSTESSLLRAHRELREVDAEGRDRLRGTSRRAADVVRVSDEVAGALSERWYDESDLMTEAAAAVTTADRGRFGTVVVHLPDELTPSAAALVGSLAATLDVVVLAGTTGDPDADRPVGRSLERLGVAWPEPSEPVTPPAAGSFAHASDADEEVRVAVRTVVEALSGPQAPPLERVAVLYPHDDPYGGIVRRQLDESGIRHNGPVGRRLSQSIAGRVALAVLGLAEDPEALTRHDLFALLGSAGLRDGEGRPVPVAAWERVSREAGVVGGLAEWRSRLGHHLERARARVDELQDRASVGDEPEWRLDRAREDLDRVGRLAAFVEWFTDRLRTLGGCTTWAELTRALDAVLRQVLVDTPRSAGSSEELRRRIDAETRAAELLGSTLRSLHGLDVVGEPASVPTLRRILAEELDRPTRVGGLGDGVLVGPLWAGVGLDLDLVVVVGAAEGDLPGRVREDSLLNDDERRRAGPALSPSTARGERLHRELLACLAGARRSVVCWPRGDLRRNAERLPSRWVVHQVRDRLGDAVPADRVDALVTPAIRVAPSFAGTMARLELPVSDREYRLAALARHHGPIDELDVVRADVPVALAVQMVRARRARELTRFDGRLPAGLVPSPVDAGRPLSPSRLQDYAACPLFHLLVNVLRVPVVENPEDLLEMTPLEAGTLVHAVLEEFIRGRLDAPPAPTERWSGDDRRRIVELAEEQFRRAETAGITGRRLLWRQKRSQLLADLRRFVDHDDAHRAGGGLTPVAVEERFGAEGPVTASLPDGRHLALRGSIDRVDRTSAGGLRVTDYKTGSTRSYADLDPGDPTQRGTKIQLVAYALGARATLGPPDAPVTADYWFVSRKGGFAHRSLEVTDQAVERFGWAVGTLVGGMEAGLFPGRPEEPTWTPWVSCQVCDPDGLGTASRHRRWLHKIADPDLRPLLELVEPRVAEQLAAETEAAEAAGSGTAGSGAAETGAPDGHVQGSLFDEVTS